MAYTNTVNIQQFWNDYFDKSVVTIEDFEEACSVTDLAWASNEDEYWLTPEDLQTMYDSGCECTVTAHGTPNDIEIHVMPEDGVMPFGTTIVYGSDYEPDNGVGIIAEIQAACEND